jgi:hypothetical protein
VKLTSIISVKNRGRRRGASLRVCSKQKLVAALPIGLLPAPLVERRKNMNGKIVPIRYVMTALGGTFVPVEEEEGSDEELLHSEG